jgi:hypothetical protein
MASQVHCSGNSIIEDINKNLRVLKELGLFTTKLPIHFFKQSSVSVPIPPTVGVITVFSSVLIFSAFISKMTFLLAITVSKLKNIRDSKKQAQMNHFDRQR